MKNLTHAGVIEFRNKKIGVYVSEEGERLLSFDECQSLFEKDLKHKTLLFDGICKDVITISTFMENITIKEKTELAIKGVRALKQEAKND